jgi:hypothetical protein
MAIMQEETWTKDDLVDLAARQKRVLVMMLLLVLTALVPFVAPALASALPLLAFVITIITVYFAYKLMTAVLPPSQTSMIIVYTILSSIPLINLVALWYLNSLATKRLRASGVSVGFFGARRSELDKLSDGVVR